MDIGSIIESGGILIIALIVFAESGLLIGFFLPGDTLLFGAGLAASQGRLPFGWLILTVVCAAVIGDNVGYSIGRRSGTRIFRREEGILFQKEHIQRAQDFYEKHGGKTIILARFVPVIRTFAPLLAGVGKMPRKRFMLFNVVGGVVWGSGMITLGYLLGKRIPHLDKYIELVIIAVIILSLILSFGHVLSNKKTRNKLMTRSKMWLRDVFLNKKID